MISNKILILVFVVASFLATFHRGREVFPIFNWALFAEAPKKFPYLKLLVSVESCGIHRRPLELLSPRDSSAYSELHELSNRFGKDQEIIYQTSWQNEVLKHIGSLCGTAADLNLEHAVVIGDPLKIWTNGQFDVERIIKLYKITD